MQEFMKELKKGKKGMNDTEKEAKLGVLKFISDAADDAIAGKVKGLKKVTVASDSEEGLKKGLEMAEDKIGEKGTKDSIMGEDEEDDEISEMKDLSNDMMDKLENKDEYKTPESLKKQVKRIVMKGQDSEDDVYELDPELEQQVKDLIRKHKIK